MNADKRQLVENAIGSYDGATFNFWTMLNACVYTERYCVKIDTLLTREAISNAVRILYPMVDTIDCIFTLVELREIVEYLAEEYLCQSVSASLLTEIRKTL
jgi:hypothetical protein